MRTYGRIAGQWVQVSTDDNGFNDQVYMTTLVQNLKLNPGESPFFANFGVPALQSVIQQMYPDLYVSRVQSYFAQFFSTLVIARDQTSITPTYNIRAVTNQGSTIITQVAL